MRVKAVTMRNFYSLLSDITGVYHEVCPQQSVLHSIYFQRSVRVGIIGEKLQNIWCKNQFSYLESGLHFVCLQAGSSTFEDLYCNIACKAMLGFKDYFH